MRKIEAHKMATRKPCETALKQKDDIKPLPVDFKGGERANKDAVDYIAEKYNIKSGSREVIELDKNIIYEYMDAKALVKETEEDIRRHRRKTIVQDKVTGSNPEFPYQPQSFNISGCVESTVSIDEEGTITGRAEEKCEADQSKSGACNQ